MDRSGSISDLLIRKKGIIGKRSVRLKRPPRLCRPRLDRGNIWPMNIELLAAGPTPTAQQRAHNSSAEAPSKPLKRTLNLRSTSDRNIKKFPRQVKGSQQMLGQTFDPER